MGLKVSRETNLQIFAIDDGTGGVDTFIRGEKQNDAQVMRCIDRMRAEAKSHAGTVLGQKLGKVLKIYDELQASVVRGFETTVKSCWDCLRTAHAAVSCITNPNLLAQAIRIGIVNNGVLQASKSKLPWSIQLLPNGELAIFSRKNHSVLFHDGSYKQVTTAMVPGFGRETQIFARVHSRAIDNEKKLLDVPTVRMVRKGLETMERFADEVGLASVLPHSVTDMSVIVRSTGATIPRVSGLMNIYPFTLEDMRKNPKKYSLREKITAIKHAIYGLHTLHTKYHQLHGDIKPENIIFQKTGRGAIEAAVSDYDFLSTYTNGQPIAADQPVVTTGYYNERYAGSTVWTAPEVFATPHFAGDHEKVEVFAVSVMMEQILTGEDPEFTDSIWNSFNENFVTSEGRKDGDPPVGTHRDEKRLKNDIANVNRSVKNSRDRCLAAAQRTYGISRRSQDVSRLSHASEEERYRYIMYAAGVRNPSNRCTFEQLQVLVNQLFPDVSYPNHYRIVLR